MSLKIIQLNIEEKKHVDRVHDFIALEQPDVICCQEIFQSTFESFKDEFKMEGFFAPTLLLRTEDGRAEWRGVAMLSRVPGATFSCDWYWRPDGTVPEGSDNEDQSFTYRALVMQRVRDAGGEYLIATTHFPKNSFGHPDTMGLFTSDIQREVFIEFRRTLERYPSFVLMGDMNMPRGTELFDTLAELYVDHIPKDIVSTLDPVLHRRGDLNYVVDCIFATPDIAVSNVNFEEGVSDHKAVIATVSK